MSTWLERALEELDKQFPKGKPQPNDYIDIVFDSDPGPEGPRFIEVENACGQSIRFGIWAKRPDGTWALRIRKEDWPA